MHSHLIDSEEESFFRTGKLKQCHSIALLARREGRTRLSVKTYYLLRTKICYGPVELSTYAVNDIYFPRKRRIFQHLNLIGSYTFLEHNHVN